MKIYRIYMEFFIQSRNDINTFVLLDKEWDLLLLKPLTKIVFHWREAVLLDIKISSLEYASIVSQTFRFSLSILQYWACFAFYSGNVRVKPVRTWQSASVWFSYFHWQQRRSSTNLNRSQLPKAKKAKNCSKIAQKLSSSLTRKKEIKET